MLREDIPHHTAFETAAADAASKQVSQVVKTQIRAQKTQLVPALLSQGVSDTALQWGLQNISRSYPEVSAWCCPNCVK